MKDKERMETVMPQDVKPEAEEVMTFLGTLTQDEGKEMLAFVRGVKFGRRLAWRPGRLPTPWQGKQMQEEKGMEVKGTFNAPAFFEALAAILSKRERVKITVTVTEKDKPAPVEPVRAAS